MNKKLLIGLSSVGVVASFWACGGGPVQSFDDDNYPAGGVQALIDLAYEQGNSYDFAFPASIDTVKKKCVKDSACADEMVRAQGKLLEMSSSEMPESSDAAPQSSSRGLSSSIPYNFSSRGPIGPTESSSSVAPPPLQSSSSIDTPPANGLGTCAPAAATAELNAQVTWKFAANSNILDPGEMMGLKYDWTFMDGTPGTSNAKSPVVTYATSGTKTATVRVVSTKGAETVTCSPVNVNGSPITGCACKGTNLMPDVAAGESATWTISGCKTGANFTLSYAWTGATADASGLTATAPVTKKGDVVSGVSVLVANNDNTKVSVTCDAAKAIDSRIPDYEIKAAQAAGKIKIPAGRTQVHLNVSVGGDKCIVFCETQWTQELQGALTMTVGGQKSTGSYNVTVGLPVSNCDDDMVDFELSAEATCGIQ